MPTRSGPCREGRAPIPPVRILLKCGRAEADTGSEWAHEQASSDRAGGRFGDRPRDARWHGAGPGRGDLRHELEGPGRAWRLLSGGGRRDLREIRPGRDDPRGRPAGQPQPAARRRHDRLQHGRRHVRRLQLRPERHPHGGGRGHVPEGPADPDGASGPGPRDDRRPQGPPDPDLAGRPHRLLGVAEGGVWLHRRPDPPLHLQPRTLPRRQERDPAGLSELGAVCGRARGRFHAKSLPACRCRLRPLLDRDRDLLAAGRGEPGPRAALRRCLDRGLVQLPVRRPGPWQRADQAGQSGDDRRADRLLDREDEGIRHRRFRARRWRWGSAP